MDAGRPRFSGNSTVKAEPFPSVLSTLIVPPIIWVSSRQIARPKPVPPNLRVAELSAWVNFSNRLGSFSGAMPTPVSVTTMRRAPEAATSMRPETAPCEVNFTALDSRLPRIWRSRSASPRHQPLAASATSICRSSDLAFAKASKVSRVCATRFATSKSSSNRVSLPASIFERSSTSFRTARSRPPDRRITSRRSRCTGSNSLIAMTSAIASTPFSGVRISWLMLARNWVLSTFAAFAASRALSSSRIAVLRSFSRTSSLAKRSLKLSVRLSNSSSPAVTSIGVKLPPAATSAMACERFWTG